MTDTPSWQDLLELVAQLTNSEVENASVQFGDVSVRLSKSGPLDAQATPLVEWSERSERNRNAAASAVEAQAPATYVSTPSAAPTTATPVAPSANTIDAPMIGVFYRRPAPGAEPFVQPGDTVTAGTTIGIVEIMKLMNPITAGQAGVIGEFLVDDGQAVEFGQPLVTLT
ncbi:MAG: acetyl-CoA carboxylase biotin carboxyl carrier protein [Microbacteriaceae bacterium]